MRTPILFKFFLCCTLLIVVALALPNPTRAAVATGAGLSDPITEALTPSAASEPISAPPADNNLQTLMTPTALDELGRATPLSAALTNEPAAVPAPEPSALLLLAIGIGVLWLIRRKR
jgi:hypothetical protein